MPFSPEVPDCCCKVRQIKVFHQPKAQHPGRPNSNIGITWKVAINLNGKEKRRKDEWWPRMMMDIIVNSVNIQGKPVGNNNFFKKPPCYQFNPWTDPFKINAMVFIKLGQQIPGSLNGPATSWRKKDTYKATIPKCFSGFIVPLYTSIT